MKKMEHKNEKKKKTVFLFTITHDNQDGEDR